MAIDTATEDCGSLCVKEVEVQFDFPLHGASDKYKVVSYRDGLLTLYNPNCQRPIGHD